MVVQALTQAAARAAMVPVHASKLEAALTTTAKSISRQQHSQNRLTRYIFRN
jgi:hypothetical protein